MVRTVGGQSQVHTMIRPQIVQTVGAAGPAGSQHHQQLRLQPQAPMQAVNVIPMRQAQNSALNAAPSGLKVEPIGGDKGMQTG